MNPGGFETIIYENQGGTAVITLNRPRVLNVYNLRMRDELFEVLGAIGDDDDVRVLVLRGAGRAFCAGADLTEFGTAPSPTVARRVRYARDVWYELDSLAIPKIAALHGFAFGSGLELALFCDFRIAAEGTQFGFPEVKLGFIPAAGGTQTLPRTIGPARAMEMLLAGKNLSTEEALEAGLITRTTAVDRLDAEWQRMAGELARARSNGGPGDSARASTRQRSAPGCGNRTGRKSSREPPPPAAERIMFTFR